MAKLPGDGAMAVVTADEPTVSALIKTYAGLSVAAVNGPLQTVVSGPADSVADLLDALGKDGVGTRLLNTSHAFHSALMDPMLEPFGALADGVAHRKGTVPVISTVTGEQVHGDDLARGGYWNRNAREAVRFLPAVRTLLERRFDAAIEIGPDPVLTRLIAKQGLDPRADRLWLPSLSRHTDDWQQILQTLGSLYAAGADINWHAVDAGFTRSRVPLPSYPFERKRYWKDTRTTRGTRPAGPSVFPGTRLSSPALRDTVFQTRFTADSPAFLADHVLFGAVVVPAASHLAMTLSAAVQGRAGSGALLDGVSFPQALTVDDAERDVQLLIEGDDGAAPRAFRVVSAPAGDDGSAGLDDPCHGNAARLAGAGDGSPDTHAPRAAGAAGRAPRRGRFLRRDAGERCRARARLPLHKRGHAPPRRGPGPDAPAGAERPGRSLPAASRTGRLMCPGRGRPGLGHPAGRGARRTGSHPAGRPEVPHGAAHRAPVVPRSRTPGPEPGRRHGRGGPAAVRRRGHRGSGDGGSLAAPRTGRRTAAPGHRRHPAARLGSHGRRAGPR